MFGVSTLAASLFFISKKNNMVLCAATLICLGISSHKRRLIGNDINYLPLCLEVNACLLCDNLRPAVDI